jgi:hypothetical protein
MYVNENALDVNNRYYIQWKHDKRKQNVTKIQFSVEKENTKILTERHDIRYPK